LSFHPSKATSHPFVTSMPLPNFTKTSATSPEALQVAHLRQRSKLLPTQTSFVNLLHMISRNDSIFCVTAVKFAFPSLPSQLLLYHFL
jgi:hypothetical protein